MLKFLSGRPGTRRLGKDSQGRKWLLVQTYCDDVIYWAAHNSLYIGLCGSFCGVFLKRPILWKKETMTGTRVSWKGEQIYRADALSRHYQHQNSRFGIYGNLVGNHNLDAWCNYHTQRAVKMQWSPKGRFVENVCSYFLQLWVPLVWYSMV